jgi:DNA polymerase IV
MEANFLAPLDVRKVPGVGKVTEKKLNDLGIRKVGDIARLSEDLLREHLGEWGVDLGAKARGEDAGGWFDTEVGEETGPKSISHEHTFSVDTRDPAELSGTLLRLSEMVGRRLREHGVHARTLHLKLRYTDFTTITRAHTLERATQLDNEIFATIRRLFEANWRKGATVRLLGVATTHFDAPAAQLGLHDSESHEKWGNVLAAADKLRDKFGEQSIMLAPSLKQKVVEKVHENPADLHGKYKKQ